MKIIVRGLALTIIGAVVIMIIMTVGGRMNRSMEIKSNLSAVVEKTVENMALTKKYDVNNIQEYLSDFTENLSCFLDTDSAITVDVMEADTTKGLLSIKVTESFKHPNGNTGTVNCVKTVILNKLEEAEPQIFTVKYYISRADMYVDQNCYKSYECFQGDTIIAPINPIQPGKTFMGWKDVNDYMADFSQQVEQNISYYAEWN